MSDKEKDFGSMTAKEWAEYREEQTKDTPWINAIARGQK